MIPEKAIKIAAFFDELEKLAADPIVTKKMLPKITGGMSRKMIYPLLLAPALAPVVGLWFLSNLMKTDQPSISPLMRSRRVFPGRASDYNVPITPHPMGGGRGGYGGGMPDMYYDGGGSYGGGGGEGGSLGSSISGAVAAARGAI